MREKIKGILRGPLISSVFYIALGTLLALLPVESVNIICKVVFGIIMILAGVYHTLLHLLESRNATMLDLFSGVILIVFGSFLFTNPLIVVKLLPVLLGSFILADSLWTLRGAIRLKKRKRGSWKILLLGSILFIALAAVLIINPFTVVKQTIIFAGCVLVANGVADLIFFGMIFFGIRKAEKEAKALEEAASMPEPPKPVQADPEYEDWNTHVAEETQTEEVLGIESEEKIVEEITSIESEEKVAEVFPLVEEQAAEENTEEISGEEKND